MEAERMKPFDFQIAEGDLLLGLGSCGIYTDYVQPDGKLPWTDSPAMDTRIPELGCTLAEQLKKPARSYDSLLARLNKRGLSPKKAVLVTGALRRSIPAVMPAGLTARIETATFPVPPAFDLIAQNCGLSRQEMYDHFNMGIGMVVFTPRGEVGQMKNALCCCGERAYIIGSVIRGAAGIELR